jgi:cellulose synthase/poly-beta-1,6-N-acetylglucosamine synthase-like glycosyltransferase
MASTIIFWATTGLIFYVFVGYPLLLWLVKLLFRRPVRKKAIEPSVSVLVAAYNEAVVIGDKIRNTLALDYPPERLEIVVASDGSSDATAHIVRSLIAKGSKPLLRLLDYPHNRGKLAVLNDAVSQLSGEIVVFSDASSMLETAALRHLVANFADPRVGAASGVYKVLRKEDANLGAQEDIYWKYETFLKIQEAQLGALTGAHGSLYAMRRSLYPFPPPGTINDDFVIPTSVLRHKLRIAYEPSAVAYEEAEQMEGFGRRIRIAAGNVAQLREVKGLLWPPQPMVLFCFFSHKAARLLVPLAMVAAFVSNALLLGTSLYQWLMVAQIAFYSLALAGAFIRLKPRILRLPYYFCKINASLFVWLYYLVSKRKGPPSSDGKRRSVVWT